MSSRSVFLSYSRIDEVIASALAMDMESMGSDVWRDQELTGGQEWWDTILDRIRSADVFVPLVSAAWIDSVPCARELHYAQALGKQVLPVRTGDSLAPGMVPTDLASRQWVDYVVDDKASAMGLVRALNRLPSSPPLPDPLPDQPDVPLSYTSSLAAVVNRSEELTATDQHSLLFQLKSGLDDPNDRDDCLSLLVKLRARRELLASVGADIDELLARPRVESGTPGLALGRFETLRRPPARRSAPDDSRTTSSWATPSFRVAWGVAAALVVPAILGKPNTDNNTLFDVYGTYGVPGKVLAAGLILAAVLLVTAIVRFSPIERRWGLVWAIPGTALTLWVAGSLIAEASQSDAEASLGMWAACVCALLASWATVMAWADRRVQQATEP
jgi:hypothetical protein